MASWWNLFCCVSCSVLSNSLRPHGFFSRQEYWSGLPVPSPGDLPNPGIERRSPALQADSVLSEPPGKPKNTGMGSLSFSRRTSQPRNWTGVSCNAGRFFTSWATREAQIGYMCVYIYISPPSWISLSPPPFHPLRSSQSTKLNCNS